MAFHLNGLLRWMELSFASQGIGPSLEQMAEKMDGHGDLQVKLVGFPRSSWIPPWSSSVSISMTLHNGPWFLRIFWVWNNQNVLTKLWTDWKNCLPDISGLWKKGDVRTWNLVFLTLSNSRFSFPVTRRHNYTPGQGVNSKAQGVSWRHKLLPLLFR